MDSPKEDAAVIERKISIGNQNFEYMREKKTFYIDKTNFIREWWEQEDIVTLITRPRRFGKTLNLSMMECFFSVNYAGRGKLFEGLSVWEEQEYRALQGTWPVIFLSFADIKGSTFEEAKKGIVLSLSDLYKKHDYLLRGGILSESEKKSFYTFGQYIGDDVDFADTVSETVVTRALKTLMSYMERYYGRKVILFLDEYDAPMQEAYMNGYWSRLTAFVRSLFNSTFKTNAYLYRGLLTGITRVSKESVFSDLNNLEVVTTTSGKYNTSFGFTQEEVSAALEERGLSAEKEHIRAWYDGFVFGNRKEIYNPWSITKYLDSGEYGMYWADTSSNQLVSELIREGTPELKTQMEELLGGGCLKVALDEQVVFEQLKRMRGAIWSLLLASGYLKPVSRQFSAETGKFIYDLKITNHETMLMFREMIAGWFPEDLTSYGDFKKALLQGDLNYMNRFMNDVSRVMFSSFDSGNKPSDQTQPERFYHGFVLGLIVDLSGDYYIRSNRESGFGRYDVMMEPKKADGNAIIMEFKVYDAACESSLEETVRNALNQIAEKAYDTDLIARGIPKERISLYGFAFQGKKVLIGKDTSCS